MSQTYTKLLIHAVWSTKRREKVIDAEMRPRLFNYMSGIAMNIGVIPLAVGGVEDHVHVLLWLKPDQSISKVIQTIKSNSSRWLNQTFPESAFRRSQRGYSAFSIGVAQVERTERYIRNQAEHHKQQSYHAELRGFLARHGLELDPTDEGD